MTVEFRLKQYIYPRQYHALPHAFEDNKNVWNIIYKNEYDYLPYTMLNNS